MQFSAVSSMGGALGKYLELFTACFGVVPKYTVSYLKWLYEQNPDGAALGFDAWDGERLAAHYACIPSHAVVGGVGVRVLLSLNTATHPNYQGQGLFTKLAALTYEFAASTGFDAVYGVANAKSSPGFTRKLGFQLVTPLSARVGLGGLGINHMRDAGTSFRRIWSGDTLAWRCANPSNPLVVRQGQSHTTFLAAALLGGACQAVAELPGEMLHTTTGGFASPLRLFIGHVPREMHRRSVYVDIPTAFRPSPLNFIYRSLSSRMPTIAKESVFLNFLDFDAY